MRFRLPTGVFLIWTVCVPEVAQRVEKTTTRDAAVDL